MLRDTQDRCFHYLRLSVTDACNYRCLYCLPKGYQGSSSDAEVLSGSEIELLVKAFARLGVWKVRLTGGEPTVRRDIVEIAQRISVVPGVRRLALSTNGYRLPSLVPALKQAGVKALNVSLNTLDRERYRAITGQDKLHTVLKGIDDALEAGFDQVKVNVVLLKGNTEAEIPAFLEWARRTPVCIRFIELMPTGGNQLSQQYHLSSQSLREGLESDGWQLLPRQEGDGPALEYTRADALGTVGYIDPFALGFCSSCNRVRVTSRGALRLCLFGRGAVDLRPLLQHDDQQEALTMLIRRSLAGKDPSHALHSGSWGDTTSFSAFGG